MFLGWGLVRLLEIIWLLLHCRYPNDFGVGGGGKVFWRVL